MTAILTEEIVPPSILQSTGVLPCHLVDPETFFADAPAEIEYAKGLCADCPIQSACLAGARERREAAGVWGGQLFQNGVVIARKRPRGRPRKNPLPVAPAARSEQADGSAASERAGRAPLRAAGCAA